MQGSTALLSHIDGGLRPEGIVLGLESDFPVFQTLAPFDPPAIGGRGAAQNLYPLSWPPLPA